MASDPNLVCVRSCQGYDVAQIFKSKLEVMGIPAMLLYESAGVLFGITVDGLGEVRIMVPAEYAENALALLLDLTDEEDAVPSDQVLDDQPGSPSSPVT